MSFHLYKHLSKKKKITIIDRKDLADYEALSRQLNRANQTVLSLAQEKVDLQYASYKAGNSDLTNVLAARRELIDQRLRVIDLENQRDAIAAQLHFTYGETAQ